MKPVNIILKLRGQPYNNHKAFEREQDTKKCMEI